MTNARRGFLLSAEQRRLCLWQAASRAFRAGGLLRLDGPLDRAALERAARQVVERHEILRTTFHSRPGVRVPVQVVAAAADPAWQLLDIGAIGAAPAGELEAEIAGALVAPEEEDLGRGPLLRLTLIADGESRHWLAFGWPALLGDAETVRLFARELAGRYRDDKRDDEPADEEPVQYTDFCDWQAEVLEAEDEDALLGRSQWRGRSLTDLGAPLLPGEPARSDGMEGFAVRLATRTVEPQLAARIAEVAQAAGAAAADFYDACWRALLGSWTGKAELTVGRLLDGRPIEDLGGVLGLLARYAPTTCRTEPRQRFSALLAEVAREAAQTREWQEYFVPEDPPAGFPCLFEALETPAPEAASGVRFTLERCFCCSEPFKVKLSCLSTDGGWRAEVAADARLLTAGEVERLAARWLGLVARAAAQPAAELGDLLLDPAERREILAEFSGPRTPGSTELVHELFEEQARRRPQAVAVVCGDVELTYGELNARANRLARALRQMGIGPESVVALYLERSAELVVALLAVLKAGGAYLPLDRALPPQRIALFLAEARAAVLLTAEALAPGLPAGDVPIVSLEPLEREWRAGGGAAAEADLPRTADPADLARAAYVLFTSGSTGLPKGVVVEHRQIVNYLFAVLDRLEIAGEEGLRFAHVSSLGADLGNTMIFPALCAGGALHLLSADQVADPERMAESFERQPVDCLKITPSHLAAMLSVERPARVLPRRRLVLGGESLGSSLVARVRDLAPGLKILNHYGPTETTVGVLTCQVDGGAELPASGLPLGWPLANTGVYVVDADLRLLPRGTVGEIVIGGANVGRGYLGRLEQTAARFLPDPFSAEPGARLYRSGDLGRYDEGRGIVFAGRADDQVKIRGFRVEPGEAEAALTALPAIRAAAVVALGEAEKRLVAYVVPAAGESLHAAELREALRRTLPEHAIPSVFVALPALPLNANGKLDRRALPAPEEGRLDLGVPFVAPRSETEQQIAGIWREVLSVEQVGVYDNFFDLGGTSLTLVQVHGRLHESLGSTVTMIDLFRYPTVGALARFLREGRPEEVSFAEREQQTASRFERLRQRWEARQEG